MLKTYQFKTYCKGYSHSSKTVNITLPGLTGETKVNALTSASETVFKLNCITNLNTIFCMQTRYTKS